MHYLKCACIYIYIYIYIYILFSLVNTVSTAAVTLQMILIKWTMKTEEFWMKLQRLLIQTQVDFNKWSVRDDQSPVYRNLQAKRTTPG